MMHELIHRLNALLAGRTPRHDNASAALRDRRWVVYEAIKIVPKNFLL